MKNPQEIPTHRKKTSLIAAIAVTQLSSRGRKGFIKKSLEGREQGLVNPKRFVPKGYLIVMSWASLVKDAGQMVAKERTFSC